MLKDNKDWMMLKQDGLLGDEGLHSELNASRKRTEIPLTEPTTIANLKPIKRFVNEQSKDAP